MLQVELALQGYAKVRWLVVDTGTWLTGRKVLVHPSAIGRADCERRELLVSLTKSQVKASPDSSIAAVTGYHIHASDGQIGHAENFLIDDATWGIRYLIIDTRNWWPGKHVLVSPYAVLEINWPKRRVRLDVSCEQVKSSPPWNPLGYYQPNL